MLKIHEKSDDDTITGLRDDEELRKRSSSKKILIRALGLNLHNLADICHQSNGANLEIGFTFCSSVALPSFLVKNYQSEKPVGVFHTRPWHRRIKILKVKNRVILTLA